MAIGFSWIANQVKEAEKNKNNPDKPKDFFSWVQKTAGDVGKVANDVGTGVVNTLFGGTKDLVETGALIPKEIMLRNDLSSGKISKEEFNTQIQEAYDKQPFFKLEKDKEGILRQKQMDPLEFLGNIGKGGLDAGLEIAPLTKAANIAINPTTKLAEVLPSMVKQGAAYGGLNVANDVAQKGELDPASAATQAALGMGGSLAQFPIVKGAQKLMSGGGKAAQETAQAAETGPVAVPDTDNMPAFMRRAQEAQAPTVDPTDTDLPAFLRRQQANPLEETVEAAPNKVMAESVGKNPLDEMTVELPSPSKSAAEKASDAVMGDKPKDLEITASIPTKAEKIKDADLATPEDMLNETRVAAAKQLQSVRMKQKQESDKLLTLKPNTAAYQQAEKNLAQYTQEEQIAARTAARAAQAKSMDDLATEIVDPSKKANIIDMIRTPERVLKKIGLEKEAKFLRSSYENYQKELPEEIDKISAWAKQIDSTENQRIFQFLDGQKVELTEKEAKIAGEVRTYLKDWAKRLGLPEDKQVSEYITHIFEKDFIKKEFDPDIARLIRGKVPSSVYNPFLQKRLGKLGYKEDLIDALDAYAKRAVRTANMNPALDAVESAAQNLDADSYAYVSKMISRVNMRPTDIENFMDNFLKSTPLGYKLGGRPTATISRTTRQMIYRATLGLNPGSAIRNLTQGANTYSKLGEKYTVIGYTKMIKNLVTRSKELDEVGVMGNDFVQDRGISAAKQTLQKVDKGLFTFFDLAERINRGAAYYGAKSKALAKGATEDVAIETAKKLVRDTQFNYGAIDTPVAMNTSMAKLLAQFQSYNVKQGEFIGTMLKEKDLAGLLRLSAASAVFLFTVGKLVGMEPKDFIPGSRMTQDGVAGGLVGPLFGLGDAAIKSKDAFGNELDPAERAKNFGDKAFKTLFPGGTQIMKTIKGAGEAQEGAAKDSAGRVKYEVGSDDAVQSVLFGSSSTEEAKQYYKDKSSGGKTKTKKRKSTRRSSKVDR